MASTEIPRVAGLTGPRFQDEYMAHHRPVVLTDGFRGQPIDAITDAAKVKAAFGANKAIATRTYIEAHIAKVKAFTQGGALPDFSESPTRELTIGQYLDEVRANPGFGYIVTEFPTHDDMLASMGVPKVLADLGIEKGMGGYGDFRYLEQLEPKTYYSMIFLGTTGTASDLHSDWDARHVLNHQVFGRKRFVLFPSASAAKLLPVDLYGMVKLRGMSDDERRKFLEYAGGMETVLEPGETIYMPPFVWHHIEYLEPAMGMSLRCFGTLDEEVRFLLRLHRDMFIQNIFAKLLREPDAATRARVLAPMKAEYAKDHGGARAKYRAMRRVTREVFEDYCTEARATAPLSWLGLDDFLEPFLCAAYAPPDPQWGKLKTMSWATRDRIQLLLRSAGLALAQRT